VALGNVRGSDWRVAHQTKVVGYLGLSHEVGLTPSRLRSTDRHGVACFRSMFVAALYAHMFSPQFWLYHHIKRLRDYQHGEDSR